MQSSANSVDFVALKFKSILPISMNKQRQIILDRCRVSGPDLFAKLEAKCGPETQYEIAREFPLEYAGFRRPEFAAVLEKALQKMLDAEKKVDPTTVYFNDSIKEPMSELKLVLNVKSKRKSVLYNPVADQFHEYDYEIVIDTLRAKLGEDGRALWMGSNTEQCQLVYRPFVVPRIAFGETGHKIFNTWTEAAWKKDWEPDLDTPRCPAEISEFMSALIDDPQDIHYTMAWLRDCVFDKAEPILVLCGVPGVGKNIFVNTIAGALVGQHNRREATRNFKDSAFHSNIANCRLFLLDEAELDPKSRETLKSYHNGTAAIERKGIDVGDPEPIFASFVLANNHWQKIKLEYSDRKFYTPTLSQSELKKSLGQEKIDRLVSCMADPDYCKNLASHLHGTYKPGESKLFPKNAFFEQVCLNSAPAWFRKFHHLCKNVESFNSREFNRGTRYRVDPFTLQDEINIYKSQRNGARLATLEILPDGSWIAESEIYTKQEAKIL